MPKRAIITAFLTAVGVVLLINFKTPSQQGLTAFNRQTAGGGQSSGGNPSPSASSGASPPASSDTPATASPTPTTVTLAGSVISYFYGTAQVQVTLQDGQITDVTALQLPNEGRSGWISQQVAPMLRDEVLSAQSAQINLISGATFTSEAYATSLQAALDRARG